MFNQLEAQFVATEKWKSLEGAYVNFTHWAFVQGDHASVPYQKKGFYMSWLRHNAYICQSGFPSIDLVIPMAFPNEKGIVTPECMSCIVISVKNCNQTEGIQMEGSLSKEAVEGVIAVRDNNKKKDNKKRKVEGETDTKADAFYTHDNHSLNVRLTLNAVKFLNPGGVTSATDDDERWIQFSEHKPLIAFAMSMAQTDRTRNLFAAETVSSHSLLSFSRVRLTTRIHTVLHLPFEALPTHMSSAAARSRKQSRISTFDMTGRESIRNLNWNIKARSGSWNLLAHLKTTNIIMWMFFVLWVNQWIWIRHFLLLCWELRVEYLSFIYVIFGIICVK